MLVGPRIGLLMQQVDQYRCSCEHCGRAQYEKSGLLAMEVRDPLLSILPLTSPTLSPTSAQSETHSRRATGAEDPDPFQRLCGGGQGSGL